MGITIVFSPPMMPTPSRDSVWEHIESSPAGFAGVVGLHITKTNEAIASQLRSLSTTIQISLHEEMINLYYNVVLIC